MASTIHNGDTEFDEVEFNKLLGNFEFKVIPISIGESMLIIRNETNEEVISQIIEPQDILDFAKTLLDFYENKCGTIY